MKTFVALALIFAYTQARYVSDQQAGLALVRCMYEQNYDRHEINRIMKNDILPTNNPAFAAYIQCYWQKRGVINENGNINQAVLRNTLPSFIRKKFGNTVNAEQLAEGAIQHCKNTPREYSHGLTIIRYRNCLMGYVRRQY